MSSVRKHFSLEAANFSLFSLNFVFVIPLTVYIRSTELYSPDLAPSDYYLFRNLKSHLHGMRFRDDDELKAATEAWFEDQIDDFYFKGIDCLKEKWAKCIEAKGDYIEK